MKKIYIALFCIFIIGFGAFSFLKDRLGNLKIEDTKIQKEGETYSLEARLPVITSGIPKKAKDKINEVLKTDISSMVQNEEKELIEASRTLKDIPAYSSLSFVSEYKETHDFLFAPFINFKFENYAYTGGAHGGTRVQTYVFNAKDGSQIFLNNILKENSLPQLGEKIFITLKEKDSNFPDYLFIEEGLSPNISNFQNFEILKEGIRFTFGDYQIGPYALGRPEVVIPFSLLQDILKEDFLMFLK